MYIFTQQHKDIVPPGSDVLKYQALNPDLLNNKPLCRSSFKMRHVLIEKNEVRNLHIQLYLCKNANGFAL